MVTITSVDVDPEMNRANVYFDSLSGEEGDAEILETLGSYRVRIQASVARQIRSKKTPILHFHPDDAIRRADRIEQILHESTTLPERPHDDNDGQA
jgi:ribosome-binding factor A